MLYTERHKNLFAFRVGRGSISRPEKDHNGRIFTKVYRPGDIIMLTREGAAAMHGNMLQEASRSAVPEITTDEPTNTGPTVPDDWREMRKADMLALAAAIAGKPVKRTSDAVEIIEEYTHAADSTDGE